MTEGDPSQAENIRPVRLDRIESPRLQRIRHLSYLLDRSITLPGGYKIGLDPILGLIPSVGDAVTTAISLYIVYEAALMGLPKRTLFKMIRNVLVDSLFGTVPLVGDVFDMVWKANARNVKLIESTYHLDLQERPARRVGFVLLLILLLILAGIVTIGVLLVAGVVRLVQSLS